MKGLFVALGVACFVAALAMYLVGSDSSHLSELVDFCWVPIPLGVLLLLTGVLKKKPA